MKRQVHAKSLWEVVDIWIIRCWYAGSAGVTLNHSMKSGVPNLIMQMQTCLQSQTKFHFDIRFERRKIHNTHFVLFQNTSILLSPLTVTLIMAAVSEN